MIELTSTRALLAPIDSVIIEAHKTSASRWRALLSKSPELALPLDQTTRANFINDHVCHEIEKGIAEIKGFDSTKALGFYAVVSPCKSVLLRFKYLGQGLPRNVPTGQQTLLAAQSFDESMMDALSLDGIDAAPTLLTAGYTLDENAAIARIEIRRDCKHHLPWSYDLHGGDNLAEPLVISGMTDTAKPARITSRRAKETEATPEAATESA